MGSTTALIAHVGSATRALDQRPTSSARPAAAVARAAARRVRAATSARCFAGVAPHARSPARCSACSAAWEGPSDRASDSRRARSAGDEVGGRSVAAAPAEARPDPAVPSAGDGAWCPGTPALWA